MKLRRGLLFAVAILVASFGLLSRGVTPVQTPSVATTSTLTSTVTSTLTGTPSATQTWTSTPSAAPSHTAAPTSKPAADQTATSTPTVPVPDRGAMTVYAVTNPNSTSIVVRHIITDSVSFRYEFTSTVPANSTIRFHLRDMPNVPNPFTGAMTLQSDDRFSATIISYDYPATAIGANTPATSAWLHRLIP